jgi:tetratricopeptide (TPR) repeat protein
LQKLVKMMFIGSAFLIIIILLLVTVWGQTIRMAEANNYFNAKNYDKAQSLYEDLVVDLPTSSYIRHNLSLCLYQEGLYEKAVDSFRKVVPKKSLSQPALSKTLTNWDIYYYHLGNSYYKAASRNGLETEAAVKLFTAALDSYKRALLANPTDPQAKYNYELTVIHLKELATQPQSQQNQQQDIDNLLQNTQNSEQYKGKLIQDNNPTSGKDW